MRPNRIGIVSGGFDPIHIGHVRMIQAAAEDCDFLAVLLNSDAWLERKKGAAFMAFKERREILEAIRGVDSVSRVDDSDGTVTAGLRLMRSSFHSAPMTFYNGGDRTLGTTPEEEFCRENRIRTVYNVGGGKIQSSSELIKKARIL